MAAKDKDTIYVDIDDEITGIIDKVKASEGKVVALVLPKRASVFQSIVNMKLLKRAADSADKNMVLITGEAGLLPLAGAAGIHVAKTLTSKPEIPSGPQAIEDTDEAIEEDEPTVGQLAGSTPPPPPADGGMETLVLDDEEVPPEEEAAAGAAAAPKPAKTPKSNKNKKLAIPNFERFRKLLIITGLVFLLITGLLIWLTVARSSATIKIKTDATNINTNLDLNLSTSAKSLDTSTNTLPAKLASQQKTYTQTVPTTGQKNTGNKATGSITMTNCSTNNSDITVPAGTGVTTNGQTYITQSNASLPFSGHRPDGSCQSANGVSSASVSITAQSGGSSFNVSGVKFTVVGHSDVSANGSASGGSDNIVQTVNQNDITSAKNKITSDDNAMKQALKSQLKGENQYPIEATYTASQPIVSSSPNVGEQASSVTVTEAITYTMFGTSKDDLNTLIENSVKTQIDTEKQSILDTGLDEATFNVNSINNTSAQLSLSAKTIAGPTLDIESIRRNAAGKRAGEIRGQLAGNPDVTSVDVHFSPFWVSTAPKKTDRIKVVIAKPTTTKGSDSGASRP